MGQPLFESDCGQTGKCPKMLVSLAYQKYLSASRVRGKSELRKNSLRDNPMIPIITSETTGLFPKDPTLYRRFFIPFRFSVESDALTT